MFDYLIVGAGSPKCSGGTIGQTAPGKSFICDKRPHIAGNAYDFITMSF